MYNDVSKLIIEQSKDLIWVINHDFYLVYANTAYLNLMKTVTGQEKKLDELVFVEGFGEGYILKWKAYYSRALNGEEFEIEEHFYNAETNEVQYSQVTFKSLRNETEEIIAIACQSRDITRLVRQRSEANQLMDASLDVYCSINEQGNFVYVSEAALSHWGYSPDSLIGKPFRSYVIEEDLPKTEHIAAAIVSGVEIRTFVNRYKKKEGGIAYNTK